MSNNQLGVRLDHNTAGIKFFENQIQLNLENIKCGGCAATIKSELKKLGVDNVEVNPETSTVSIANQNSIDFEPDKLGTILEVLKRLGYPLIDSEEGLSALAIKAKSYVSCALGKLNQ